MKKNYSFGLAIKHTKTLGFEANKITWQKDNGPFQGIRKEYL